jgi:hypothetical protein
MTKLVTLLLAAALVLSAASKTFTGVVTDTMCGANHKLMNVTPDSKCVRDCVKAGAKYALLVGDKVYALSDQQTPDKFAGEKVKVTGTLNPKTSAITVQKIERWEPVVKVPFKARTQAEPPAPQVESTTWASVGQAVSPATNFHHRLLAE